MSNQKLVDILTVEQKVRLMSGKDTWTTVAYEEVGVPSLFLSDGPHGLRKQAGASDHLGLNESIKSTCYPTAATIANSWDLKLIRSMGEHLGQEALALNVDMILGPGLNIKRNPLCGRNFEYLSEDPYLSGKLASSLVQGIQNTGVFACPKHFAVNSQELKRMVSDSIVDEQTLRELYLTAFEIVVKESDPKAIMSSYNKINGVYANENAYLLQKILREEWGFKGIVVSDWGGSNDHVLGVRNGSHLEMPSTGTVGAQELIEAIEKGLLDIETLNQRVEEYLKIVKQAKRQTVTIDWDAHHSFARHAAAESIVLLKNDQNILPLQKGKKIAIIGDFAEKPRYQGAGSSTVNPTRIDNLIDVAKQETDYSFDYAKGYERNQPSQVKLTDEAISIAKRADVVLLCVGLDEFSESEGMDREHMRMPSNQLDLIERISSIHENVIIVLSAGSVIEMPFVDKVKGIVHGYLGGQASASAMMDILLGRVNPSGKLAESYPFTYEDVPNHKYYPAYGKRAEYREGLFVGYRYYDTVAKKVCFPFGYGLSYTQFEIRNIELKQESNVYAIYLEIQNTGECSGAEVIQLYVGRESESNYPRAKQELKAFSKIFLEAQETKKVRIELDDKAFRSFDVNRHRFVIETGDFQVRVGTQSRHILWQSTIHIEGDHTISNIDKEKLSPYFAGQITDVQDDVFATLMQGTVDLANFTDENIPIDQNGKRELERNDIIGDLHFAKGLIGKLTYRVLDGFLKRAKAKGVPNLNAVFISNMPFRGLAKMAGGRISMTMVDDVLLIVNGHGCKGITRLIANHFKLRRIEKNRKSK